MSTPYLLPWIPAVGALVTLGLLIRNLVRSPRIIRESGYPAYTRLSCNLSHLISGAVIASWGAAAWVWTDPAHWEPAIEIMASPLLVVLLLLPYGRRWHDRHSEWVPEYAKRSRRRAAELKSLHDAGRLTDLRLASEIHKLRQETVACAKTRVVPARRTPHERE